MTKVIEIQPTVLGRKNAEYARLIKGSVAQERIVERMAEDAIVFGVTLEDYQARLAEVGKSHGESKRAAQAVLKGEIQGKHLEVTSFLNEIITTGQTDVPALQVALKELAEKSDGWVLMTACEKDGATGEGLFTINDSGWSDGSNRQNQYSDRPQMVGKSGKHVPHPFKIHGAE